MNYYNYFLYRLYIKLWPNYGNSTLLMTTMIATLVVYLFLFFVYELLVLYFSLGPYKAIGKEYFVIGLVVLGYLNYYFIKDKKFLHKKFKEDKKGGVLILLTIGVLFLGIILAANENRERLRNRKYLPKMERIKS